MRRHQYPAGFPVRLALKDLPLVCEVEQSSQATMPLLDAVLERFYDRKRRARRPKPGCNQRTSRAGGGLCERACFARFVDEHAERLSKEALLSWQSKAQAPPVRWGCCFSAEVSWVGEPFVGGLASRRPRHS